MVRRNSIRLTFLIFEDQKNVAMSHNLQIKPDQIFLNFRGLGSITGFCLLLFSSSLFSQNESPLPSFRFEIIDLPNGELGNHVQAIAQDSMGFMWFGSQYGLHRYDGYQVKTYIHDPADPSTIASSYVEYIYVAKDGTLWLGHWGAGLDLFDPRTEEVTHYTHDPNNPETISNNFVTEILEDREGYLWATSQNGVNRLDLKTGKFKRFQHDPKDSTSLSYDKCRSMYMDSDGILWFGTGWAWEGVEFGGLNRYHPKTATFTRYRHNPKDPKSLRSNKVFEIFEDSKGNFWIGTEGDGLHLMDRKTETFTHFPQKEKALCAPYLEDENDDHVKVIFEDTEQKLWIGSWKGGLKYFDSKTKLSEHFYIGSHFSTIPENFVWNIIQSKDGTLWGLTAGGNASVFKIVKEDSAFDHFSIGTGNRILCFFQRNEQELWFATQTTGLVQMTDQKYFTYEKSPVKEDRTFPTNRLDDAFNPEQEDLFDDIYKIQQDAEGYLWFVTGTIHSSVSRLMRLQPETGDFQQFTFEKNKNTSISSHWVMDILADKKGRIWIAAGDGALNLFIPESNTFEKFVPPVPFSEVVSEFNMVARLGLANDGMIWYGGAHFNNFDQSPLFFYQFNPDTKIFTRFDIKNDKTSHTTNEIVQNINADKKGNIWFVAPQFLYRFNPKTNTSRTWSNAELGTNRFLGMTEDDYGRMWILADGLIVFDPEEEKSFTYNPSSGIQNLPFARGSIFKALNGKIIVGGRGGFHSFDPQELLGQTDPNPPEILITDFTIPDHSLSSKSNVLLAKDFWENSELNLSHNQNVFTFRFAALDFLQPENNRHEFKLEGYDDHWRIAGLEPMVTYIKVPPGDYTFKVRAANYQGQWGNTKAVRVLISPPWWESWWAKVLYILGALGLIFGVYRFQLTRQLAQAEARRLKELDTAKTQLYTNITHEFRTPLSVILGMARQVVDDPKAHFRQGLDMIIRNGENLLSLVNQMLDLSKLENGKLVLNLIQNNVVNFLKYLAESFHSYAESRGVQVHFLSESDSVLMDYDPEKLQQIVVNLLSNAVKFTQKGGHVYLQLIVDGGSQTVANENFLKIVVKDTGMGIPEDKLPHVFDRFYQVDDSMTKENEGSGIGLALTKELVKLMGGEISVKSQLGKGSEFIVNLPIRKTAQPGIELKPKLQKETFPFLDGNFQETRTPFLASKSNSTEANQLLLVEDNPDVVQYLTSCLAPHYRLHIATDGQEGLDLATEIIPDLIISDIMMPQKDGFEVCDILKNDERTSHIPIIMLTAKADVESRLEGLKKGADAYLGKPFHKEELLVRIEKLLELREKLQNHYLKSGLGGGNNGIKDIPDVQKTEHYFVKKVRKVVEKNMENFDLTVEQLCKEIGMSNSQLHRKLSALTGFSATKFIRYVRLTHAKTLLQNPNLTITAVAFDSGFNDPSYFGRVFKKEFGVTPVEWRENIVLEKLE